MTPANKGQQAGNKPQQALNLNLQQLCKMQFCKAAKFSNKVAQARSCDTKKKKKPRRTALNFSKQHMVCLFVCLPESRTETHSDKLSLQRLTAAFLQPPPVASKKTTSQSSRRFSSDFTRGSLKEKRRGTKKSCSGLTVFPCACAPCAAAASLLLLRVPPARCNRRAGQAGRKRAVSGAARQLLGLPPRPSCLLRGSEAALPRHESA